jgi:hypothetical protein
VNIVAKQLVEITGFKELQDKIKTLSNDKDKRRPILAILRKSAKSTIDAARQLAPKRTQNLAKSIKFQVMRRAVVPMGIVGPRSIGKYDGWYGRQFVIPGYAGKKRVSPNFFMNRALQQTQRQVIGKAIPQTEKFIQKQIDKL